LRTLIAANNYATSLTELKRFGEGRSLLRKAVPVARRVKGDANETTLRLRWNYAKALYKNTAATLDDLREAATTLEEVERTARRVFGGTHPIVLAIEEFLQTARALLRAREAAEQS